MSGMRPHQCAQPSRWVLPACSRSHVGQFPSEGMWWYGLRCFSVLWPSTLGSGGWVRKEWALHDDSE